MLDSVKKVNTVNAGVVVHLFVNEAFAVLVNIDVRWSKHVDLQSCLQARNNEFQWAGESIHVPEVCTGCLSHANAVTGVARVA